MSVDGTRSNKLEAFNPAKVYQGETMITIKRSQTSREQCLIILVLFAVFFALFVAFNLKFDASKASLIPKSINASVDPLEDCNQFTCRHWVAQHPITVAANDLDSSTLIRDESTQTLKGLRVFQDRAHLEAAVAYSKSTRNAGKTLQGICRTFDCLKSGANINNNIDTRVDPCKDFYQFACGRWIKENSFPEGGIGSGGVSQDALIAFVVEKTLTDLLNVDDSSDPEAVQQARAYFRSCMDVDTLAMHGTEPLVDFIDSCGIYPTFQPWWIDTGMTFSDIVEYLTQLDDTGFDVFIIFGVSPDVMQSDKNIITFVQAILLLGSPSAYLGIRMLAAQERLKAMYLYTHLLLGADLITAAQDAEDVVEFEIKLAKATIPSEEQSDKVQTDHKMTLGNLTDRFPQFDWLRFLRNHFSKTGEDFDITMDEVVAVRHLHYYDNLFALIDETPTRTLLNYGMWRRVMFLSQFLAPDFRELMYGPTNRERTCLGYVKERFFFAVARMYVDRLFSPQDKLKVENIFESLMKGFKKMLKDIRWLSQATKTTALKKLSSMVHKIGYPEFVLDNTALNAETEMYSVDGDDFFGTSIDILQEMSRVKLKNLRKPVDRTEWTTTEFSVNGFYDPNYNDIVLPAAILTYPFYAGNFTDSLLYGSLGMIIAHEITHAFHGSGSLFDEKGNLHNWWRQKDLKVFQNRTQCLVDQYNHFVDKELNVHVDGVLTLEENIADNCALREAFKAYRSVIDERGREEDKYPSLPYTPDQLFFIGFAQSWCDNFGPELRLKFWKDSHSPSPFRVTGTIQNNKDFGRVFNCPIGKPMNPKKKCEVW